MRALRRAGWGGPAAAAVLLAAAALCALGPGLGFYVDDWALLAELADRPGLMDQLRAHGSRPLSALAWTLPHALFGARPGPWHALMAALQALLAGALYRCLRGFGAPRTAALLGALVFLSFPNKDSTLYWPAVSLLNSSALLLLLGAWLCHARYVAEGGERRRWSSALLLFLSLCVYEQAFFVLPAWLLARGDAARARRGLAAGAAGLLAFAALRFGLLPLLAPSAKALRVSPGHGVFVYYMALRATLDPRWWLYCARCAAQAFVWTPAAATAAMALPWLAATLLGDEERWQPRRLAAWGAVLWFLGYLPFAFSDYAPASYDEMNRLNQLPAVGLAAALCAAASRARGRLALAALASAGLAAHVGFKEIWTEAARRQDALRERVLAALPRWPADKGLLVRLEEPHVARKAPVFIGKADLSGAVRLWTGARGREAWPLTPQVRFEPDGAVLFGEKRAYGSLLLLEAGTGRLVPLDERVARSLPPPLEPWERPLAFWPRR